MSGSTIGGVIGAAVGFYVGGPQGAQWGWMIGSAIGGYVDPTVLTGPKLTDPQRQTSSDGVPRPIVYGTAAIMGNVIQVQSGPTEHKHKERQGKGGPVQETFTYTRTVAFRICEAAPLGGEMKLRRAWVNGKLGYDATGSGTIDVDSAKFFAGLAFYSGSETQLPDPDLEALPVGDGGGVGNVPAYRGTCYAVLRDCDVSNGGALPQIRWEVSSDAVATINVSHGYAPPDYSRFTNTAFPLANAEADYDFVEATGEDASGTTYAALASSTAACQALAAGEFVGWGEPDNYVGYMKGGAGPYSSLAGHMEGHGATTDLTDYREAWLLYNWHTPAVYHSDVRLRGGDGVGDVAASSTGGAWHCDALGVVYRSYATHDASLRGFTGSVEGFTPLAIRLQTKQLAPVDVAAADETPLPDRPGWVVSNSGVVRQLRTYTLTSGSFRTLALESTDGMVYAQRELGPVLAVGDADDTSAYWDAAYAVAVAAGTMPAGMTYSALGTGGSTTYPRNKSTAYAVTTTTQLVTPNLVPLDAVVGDIIERGDVTDYEVSALASDNVRGFAITQPTDAAGAIRALQPVYFFDLPEYGNSGDTYPKLRAVKRGGASVLNLTDDALVDTDDDEDTRAQAVEFPRKVNLMAPDPDASYEVTKQTAERTSENVKATGEANISTAVIFTADERAQIADISQKVAWEEQAGRAVVTVPEEYTQYVTSDIITRNQKRFRIDAIRQGDGQSRWELTRDRASAYSSNATAGTTLTPPAPASSIRGPTLMQALNLPSLRSSDNVPGMYVGVCGLLPGWIGCDLYVSVDGGLTEQKVATILDPAIMGTLSADMTAGDVTLAVSLYNDDELDTVTTGQLAARLNGAAVTSSGVSEILQFQTATDTGAKAYDLTDLTRPLLGTAEAAHTAGDDFVLLDQSVVFIPIDASHAGGTLIFRPVSRGTVPANNVTYSVVFDPQFTSGTTISYYTDALGARYTDASGAYYYKAA